MNEVEAPFAVEVDGTIHLSPEMAAFLTEVVTLFNDAREELGADVSISLR